MTHIRHRCAAAVAALCMVASHASSLQAATPKATNLVKNGSFETPPVPAGDLDRYGNGQTIGNWTVTGASGTVDVISSTFQYEDATFPAQSGGQWLDLTGASQTETGVVQTVKTKVGHNYTLTFYVGTVYDPGGQLGVASSVKVLVNGKQLMIATNSNQAPGKQLVWQKFTDTIKATRAKTTLEFLNEDPPNDTANGLDTVSLVAAP